MFRHFCLFLVSLLAVTTQAFAAEVDQRSASEFQLTRESFGNPLMLIDTSMGEIVVELFPAEAPDTVANFIGLAEGTKGFTDPVTGQQVMRPFFDGLVFHRVIDGFMIQTGSPTGESDGDPGYSFDNEINARSLGLDRIPALNEDGIPHPYLGINSQRQFQLEILAPLYEKMGIEDDADVEPRVDEIYDAIRALTVMDVNQNLGYRYSERYQSRMPLAGSLAMAHAGPGTNGSQFFLTLADTPWLTGKYTVFAKVRAGMDVAERIGRVQVNLQDRPLQDVVVHSIRRLRE